MIKGLVHFSSKSDNWETPQDIFDSLNLGFGPFTLDVCASKENTKCHDMFYSIEEDGLSKDWHKISNKCWMNPPYGRQIGKWIKKAYEESQKGALVCCLLPARTDTKWFHEYLQDKDHVLVRFLKGRLKFGGAKNSAPFPSMVVVFYPCK
jgi:phage N-6-adenine-methyltransferase